MESYEALHVLRSEIATSTTELIEKRTVQAQSPSCDRVKKGIAESSIGVTDETTLFEIEKHISGLGLIKEFKNDYKDKINDPAFLNRKASEIRERYNAEPKSFSEYLEACSFYLAFRYNTIGLGFFVKDFYDVYHDSLFFDDKHFSEDFKAIAEGYGYGRLIRDFLEFKSRPVFKISTNIPWANVGKAMRRLVINEFLHKDSSEEDFKALFGKENKNRIPGKLVWIGSIEALRYFFSNMFSRPWVEGYQRWPIVVNWFVDSSGQGYDINVIRRVENPDEPTQTKLKNALTILETLAK